MAQFDIFRLANGQLVVDLQTDLIGLEVTRIVAPLREADHYAAFPGLTPVVDVDNGRFVVRLPELAAISHGELSEKIGSLEAHRDSLKRGLDILIDGF